MSEKQINEVVEFIRRRFPQDCNWTNGNCWWFAAILIARFPYLSIYYLAIQGHFVAGALNTYFDWTGQIFPEENPISFKEIEKIDKTWYERLVRDCVL
jgi:hypothetical protein